MCRWTWVSETMPLLKKGSHDGDRVFLRMRVTRLLPMPFEATEVGIEMGGDRQPLMPASRFRSWPRCSEPEPGRCDRSRSGVQDPRPRMPWRRRTATGRSLPSWSTAQAPDARLGSPRPAPSTNFPRSLRRKIVPRPTAGGRLKTKPKQHFADRPTDWSFSLGCA